MNKIVYVLLFIAVSNLVSAQQTAVQRDQEMKAMAANVPLVEEVNKIESEVVIPYKRYKLSNGLNIIIHEDHSDPVCYVDITYHVGSAREQQGRSGFAHFFEHMMFQGSKHVADDQHFKIITEAGGTLNGTTNTDRTNYFETVPSNQLEKMLWLEADRMGFLLDSVTQKKFEVQRATVKNERGQRYDNAPYGLVGEKIGEALYPIGHPYSWTTIGYIEDLNRVDVNDLKRFYLRWYGPNNAVLTVAGDVYTNEVLAYAQKYFGNIGKCPEVKDQAIPSVTLSANRYISYEDNIKFPMLNVAYPTVKANTKEDAALDVLSQILSGSQSSPLYKAFVESKKAVSASSYQYSRELAGQFQLVVRGNANSTLADNESALMTVLSEWEKHGGVTDDDIVKFKAQYQSNLYNQLSTVQGKGSKLAASFTLAKNANNIKKETLRYMSITKADVMNVYNTFIKNKPAVILSCVPKGKSELKAKPDNWTMYTRSIEAENSEYKNLTYKEPKDEFKRSIMPVSRAARGVDVPDFYQMKVAENIPLIGVYDKEIPKVNILISLRAGHRSETMDKSGLVQLLSSMLEQSTMKTSAAEIENKLDRLGSTININSNDEELNINIQSLKQNVNATLKIVEELLFEPKFDPTEFELEKKKQSDAITQMQSNASSIADITFRRMLYGETQVMSLPAVGTLESVKNITLDDIKNFYAKLNAQLTSIAISGDANKEEVSTMFGFLSKFKQGSAMAEIEASPVIIDKTKIYFVDKKNAAQSEIRIGCIGLPYEALGEYYSCSIMNFSFGGAFNSRINYLLREIKGWTYGTRSSFSGTKFPGPFAISGGFKANTTDSSLVELIKELKKYSESGCTDEELSFTKNAMLQSDALKYESPFQKLGFIKRVMDYNLPRDVVAKQMNILNSIGKTEISNLAKRHLKLDKMIVIVVGDKASNFEKVKSLGYEVVEVDINGKVVN